MLAFYYAIVGLLLLVKGSFGCSCAPLHPQTAVCEGNFAIVAKPLFVAFVPHSGDTDIPNDAKGMFEYDNYLTRIYIVKVMKVFKGNGISEGQTITIITAGSSATCGIQLTKYNQSPVKWLLVGRTDGTTNRVNSCGWNKPWSQVFPRKKQRLNNKNYLDNCDCPIVQCSKDGFNKNCDKKPACKWHEPKFEDCYMKKLFCKKQISYHKIDCRWSGRPGAVSSCTSSHLNVLTSGK